MIVFKASNLVKNWEIIKKDHILKENLSNVEKINAKNYFSLILNSKSHLKYSHK